MPKVIATISDGKKQETFEFDIETNILKLVIDQATDKLLEELDYVPFGVWQAVTIQINRG